MCRSVAMLGSAILAIEPSSTAMLITIACASTAHFRRDGASPSNISLMHGTPF